MDILLLFAWRIDSLKGETVGFLKALIEADLKVAKEGILIAFAQRISLCMGLKRLMASRVPCLNSLMAEIESVSLNKG